MTSDVVYRPRVLADVVPGGLVANIALVVSAAALVGLSAQAAIPLPFTPVPLSLATFSVLLAGAALGPVRAGAAMLLYLAAGMAGVPWFSEQASGWNFPSFGYIIGFVFAAAFVGELAKRGADRTVVRTAGLMVLGNLVIYAVGAPWLATSLQIGAGEALKLGVLPFLPGDALKVMLAAGLLPAAWKLVGRVTDRR